MTQLPVSVEQLEEQQKASLATGSNGVKRLMHRLGEAFPYKEPRDYSTTNDACVRALARYLKRIGWTQGDRRVFEAMPHIDPVSDLNTFRAVMHRLGFRTTLETAELAQVRAEFLPCFLRAPDGNIQVIEDVSDDQKLRIYDPLHRQTVEVGRDAIQGTLIFPEPYESATASQETPTEKWSDLVLARFKPVIGKIFVLSFLTNLFAMCPPLYVMTVYDKAIGSRSLDVLLGLSIGILMIVAADFVFRSFRGQLQAYLGARLDNQVNESTFRHLLHLPITFTENAPVGSQLTRLKQMGSIRDVFTGMLATAMFDLPFVILFIGVILLIGGSLVLVPVTLMIGYIVLAVWAIPATRRAVRDVGNKKSQLQNLLVEAVSSQPTIHELNAEDIWLDRHRRLSAETAMANTKARQLNNLVQTLSQAFVTLGGVLVLGIGVAQVIEGTLSPGALIAVMALSWRILGPLRSIFLSGLTLGQTMQSIDQINRLLKMPLEKAPNAAPSLARKFSGQISLDRVSFRYPSQREPALRGVSLEAKRGQLVCICGASGAGKSTVLKMIMGLYQQQGGAVLADGLDIRQIDTGEWRQSLGVSLERSQLFYGTVAQNIRLAHPSATDQELEAIADQFSLGQYYGGPLDEGLKTRVTSRRVATWPEPLKKRICLARAFIRNVPIYLLDNPSDNLDEAGDRALLAAIAERRQESTIIMTTHRPSHMRIADTLVWLDQGMVKAADNPENILPAFLAA